MITSLFGAFYYLRIVKLMYFDEPLDSNPIKADVCNRALLTINGEMANTAHMVAEISHATSEQQNAMGELSANINRVAEMTEQNVGVVSQAERLTDELDGSVDRMLKSVGQYTV